MNEDSIKATPQNPYLGAISNGLQGFNTKLDDMGLGLLSRGLGTGAAERVFQDMSYGSPPYRGNGMATRLTPDAVATIGSVANLGGFMPIGTANRLASGLFAAPMIENQSLDSVIQNLLNALGRQTQGR